jgi:murein DD-endopeptidase MepM/ murein hydrolase activator NlpD
MLALIVLAAAVIWPVPNPILRGFEPPPAIWAAGHRGIDFVALPGTPVRAPRSGVVSFVGMVADKPVLTVRHGHVRSTYEPVTSSLRIGQAVHAGDVLGIVARGDSHCDGMCLHWGLKQGADYLDPRLLIARTARLIPLHDPRTQSASASAMRARN